MCLIIIVSSRLVFESWKLCLLQEGRYLCDLSSASGRCNYSRQALVVCDSSPGKGLVNIRAVP